jgi:hypothetical protein
MAAGTASSEGHDQPLVCPQCATRYPREERFCRFCGVPLVHGSAAGFDEAGELDVRPISERHERARKIKPQLAEGKLVRVAGARNQAEGEFIQGLLLEEGVPSLLRRTAGFDVPDFLAAGPRDVLVPESGAVAAREILLEAELISPEGDLARVVAPGKLLAGLVAGLVIVALVVWLMFEVLR